METKMARRCELVNHLNLKLWKHHSVTFVSSYYLPATSYLFGKAAFYLSDIFRRRELLRVGRKSLCTFGKVNHFVDVNKMV